LVPTCVIAFREPCSIQQPFLYESVARFTISKYLDEKTRAIFLAADDQQLKKKKKEPPFDKSALPIGTRECR
jgi:hypothetical protein